MEITARILAFVLINAKGHQLHEALEELQGLQAVRFAKIVTGPYDIIAIVGIEDMKELGHLVTEQIQKIPGVERTLSCIGIEI